MQLEGLLDRLLYWSEDHLISLVISIALLLFYFFSRTLIKKLIRRHASKNNFVQSRSLYVMKVTGMVNFILFSALLGFTWEISLSGLSLYFASIFTVVGVGLFANWSILSNITASVILFFFFPYKIGSRVKIQDGDNSIEGQVIDITMFYMEIEIEESKIVSYPNNLAMQKPFILMPDKAE